MSACPSFDNLEQFVDCFWEVVELARMNPDEGAVDVTADHLSHCLCRLDFVARHVASPIVQGPSEGDGLP